ncbi:MAG: Ca-activated chloride channel, partial [Pseudonocardiales bacterium]|nr:Ca-activated chloride channel [Pseudonocardiales bacterium]
MTINVTEFDEYVADEPRGTGCLTTERGNLPLHKLDVRASVTGLVARTELVQGFRNPYDTSLEATYVFPLPDRAALTAMTLTADGRTVVADLQERAQARQAYDDAIAAGQRASIAEEERPDV